MAEQVEEQVKADPRFYETANAARRLGGRGLPQESNLWMELQLLLEEEQIKEYNRNHPNAIPATKKEILQQRDTERLSKLRRLKDKVTYLKKTKLDELRKLREKVSICSHILTNTL